MRGMVHWAFVALLSAGAAGAQWTSTEPSSPAAASSDAITAPEWVSRPSGDDMARLYPPFAAANGIDGAARLRCQVAENGFLTGCIVLEESPAGCGFGVATLGLAPRFRMRPPMSRSGRPVVGATVIVPVRWSTDDGRPSSWVRCVSSTSQDAEHLVVNPLWSQAPTRIEVARISAEAAAEGEAVIRCRVQQDGRLGSCSTGLERGHGVGAAARRLSDLFQLRLPADFATARGDVFVDVPVHLSPNPAEFIMSPPWTESPPAAELRAVMEPIASGQPDLTAGATLDCRVAASGRLEDCRAARATPEAAGPALLSLAPRFAMQVWTNDGRPTVGARVRLPIRYVADDLRAGTETPEARRSAAQPAN